MAQEYRTSASESFTSATARGGVGGLEPRAVVGEDERLVDQEADKRQAEDYYYRNRKSQRQVFHGIPILPDEPYESINYTRQVKNDKPALLKNLMEFT